MNPIFSMIMALAAAAPAADTGAIVNIPVACLRQEPRHAAQMVSQAVAGTPLAVVAEDGEWLEVELPDGYRGYMTASSVTRRDIDRWRGARRGIVTDPAGCRITSVRGSGNVRDILVHLPLNSIVELTDSGSVVLPDGREGWPCGPGIADFSIWAEGDPDGGRVVETAYFFRGAPYLWGGITGFAPDCSGLVSLCYFAGGAVLRRDAWMQAEDCEVLDAPSLPGDLIFFDRNYDGRIDHVAIYDHDTMFIHSSGMVKVNTLDAARGDTISGAVTGFGRPLPSRGYTLVRNHPWYFRHD